MPVQRRRALLRLPVKRAKDDEESSPEVEMPHYEASSDVRGSAATLRGVHLAFLEVGFGSCRISQRRLSPSKPLKLERVI